MIQVHAFNENQYYQTEIIDFVKRKANSWQLEQIYKYVRNIKKRTD